MKKMLSKANKVICLTLALLMIAGTSAFAAAGDGSASATGNNITVTVATTGATDEVTLMVFKNDDIDSIVNGSGTVASQYDNGSGGLRTDALKSDLRYIDQKAAVNSSCTFDFSMPVDFPNGTYTCIVGNATTTLCKFSFVYEGGIVIIIDDGSNKSVQGSASKTVYLPIRLGVTGGAVSGANRNAAFSVADNSGNNTTKASISTIGGNHVSVKAGFVSEDTSYKVSATYGRPFEDATPIKLESVLDEAITVTKSASVSALPTFANASGDDYTFSVAYDPTVINETDTFVVFAIVQGSSKIFVPADAYDAGCATATFDASLLAVGKYKLYAFGADTTNYSAAYSYDTSRKVCATDIDITSSVITAPVEIVSVEVKEKEDNDVTVTVTLKENVTANTSVTVKPRIAGQEEFGTETQGTILAGNKTVDVLLVDLPYGRYQFTATAGLSTRNSGGNVTEVFPTDIAPTNTITLGWTKNTVETRATAAYSGFDANNFSPVEDYKFCYAATRTVNGKTVSVYNSGFITGAAGQTGIINATASDNLIAFIVNNINLESFRATKTMTAITNFE